MSNRTKSKFHEKQNEKVLIARIQSNQKSVFYPHTVKKADAAVSVTEEYDFSKSNQSSIQEFIQNAQPSE